MTETYYNHAGITIYQGDCLDIMPSLPEQSIDAIIADIPYGTTACSWDSVIPFDAMWACIKRVIKPRGAVVLFGSEPFSSFLRLSNLQWYRYDWIWEKDTPTGFLDANRKPLKAHEVISVFYKSLPTYNPQKVKGPPNHSSKMQRGVLRTNNTQRKTYRTENDVSGLKYPRSVIKFAKYSETEDAHPTQKPLALMQYLIRTYTNAGDLVLDFTMGSGTTLEAAKIEGRRAIGIEKDADKDGKNLGYCAYAVQRLQQEVMPLWKQ